MKRRGLFLNKGEVAGHTARRRLRSEVRGVDFKEEAFLKFPFKIAGSLGLIAGAFGEEAFIVS